MSTLRVEALEQPDGTAFVFNNKNLLINGGMNVWQRSTSKSITATGYQTADRYEYSLNGSGVYTQSRSTDVPSEQGFGYSMKMDVTTANASPSASNYSMFMQKMEGQNLQYLLKGTSNAKKLTLSFWVKSNKTGTYIVRISDEDNSRTIAKAYTIDTASTWQKVELTFDGDTTGTLDNDNAESLTVQWWLSAGSTYTSGTLATSWESTTNANIAVGQVNLLDSTSNEWYITGIQLEVGSTASGFEFEPYEATLRKCLRYFYQLGGASIYERIGAGVCRTSTRVFITTDHPAPMRAVPTLGLSAASDFSIDGSGGTTCSAISITHTSTIKLGLDITLGSSGDSAGSGAQLVTANTLNAQLRVKAEL